MLNRTILLLAAGSAIGMIAVAPTPAIASPAPQSVNLDIPAQDMDSALQAVASATGQQIVFSSDAVRGLRGNPVKGIYSADQAIRVVIRGSGLTVTRSPRGVFVIASPAVADRPAIAPEATTPGEDIIVTGTYIRGGPIASPTVRVAQRQMREAGQSDLGEVIRSIPSNYAGGQSPGSRYQTGNVSNTNVSGGSGINLRGLGPDATLTLLNGRRLAFDSDSQAVDISAIPLAAVSEIQIVPDGASALYGSDAVAGVANVILKRDFGGLSVSARLGTATDGGGFQQVYEAVAGARGKKGGFLVAATYDRQNAVRSDQRDYTRYVIGPNTLLDRQRHYSGLLTGHVDLTPTLTLSVDALYSHRRSAGAEYSTEDFASPTRYTTESYAVSPTLTLALPNNWSMTLSGFTGADNTDRFDDFIDKISGENLGLESRYKNSAYGSELDAEGRLWTLPGGDIRLALGGGYRHNYFSTGIIGVPGTEGGSRSNYYGFGEISIPLVSASNATPWLYQLAFSGALRHEEYDRFGGVTTPKLGAVYAPSPDIALKFSWGRSFKAPTLLQQYRNFSTALRFATQVGGAGFPAGATVLVTGGGNPDLRPERARTLSATVELHPHALSGLNLSATYFDVDYSDRVVQPLLPPFAALSSPVLAQFIDYNPTPAKLAALIALDRDGLLNATRMPYDPAKVVAIANGVLINAARQRIRGVDIVGNYRISLGAADDITLSGQGSWLASSQRNSAGAPVTKLAGTNFNPPKFRGRGGLTGHFGALTAAAFVNYAGGLLDTTAVPAARGASMTTLDVTLIWKIPASAEPLRGLELSLSVQNLTNTHPPYLAPLDDTAVNYDSTNYSPLGRFISATVRKNW